MQKWIRDLNARANAVQLLEENRGNDTGFGRILSDMTAKAQATKAQ